MLACTALVGCSDDVIEETSMNPMADKTPAYLSISFGLDSSSSRSTADDANNLGDKDGSAEDSYHFNVGTEAENTVSTALVVVAPTTGNSAHAQLYTVAKPLADGATEPNEYDFLVVGKNYNSETPIKLTVGEYKVLVVANPPSTLLSNTNLSQGVKDVATVNALYEQIKTGSYTLPTTPTDFDGEIVNDEKGYITMANKSEVSVTLKANETVTAPVEIERVASKITFRHKETTVDETTGNVTVDDTWPIKVYVGRVSAKTITHTFTIDEKETEVTLNVATFVRADKTMDLYVHVGENDVKKYYDNDFKELTLNANEIKTINYLYDESQAEEVNWNVKIEGYALVNLAKEVNYVRHTTTGDLGQAFGTLTGSNFLWTPYWAKGINDVAFDDEGNFIANTFSSSWFLQTLAEVSTESKGNANTTYYKVFGKKYDNPNNVENKSDAPADKMTQHTKDLENIGETLAYCLENSTDIEHQTHGLSTGISFKARIYDESGNAVNDLYRYGNHIFESIADIVEAYDGNVSDEIKNLANNPSTESPETLAAAGISKYDENICYYYTTEIKHYDNGNPNVLGNMEFAIMRNNIYSLSIAGISKIGDPFVDPTPSIPNEHPEAALQVKATIIPWIVRYHDIEF